MYLLENLLAQATIVITPLHVWDSLLSLREVSMHHRQNKTYCDRKSTSSIPVSQSVTMCHNVSKCDMIIYMIILAPWHSPLFVLGTTWWLLGWLTLVEWLGKKLMAQNHLATYQTILFIWWQPMADPNSPKLWSRSVMSLYGQPETVTGKCGPRTTPNTNSTKKGWQESLGSSKTRQVQIKTQKQGKKQEKQRKWAHPNIWGNHKKTKETKHQKPVGSSVPPLRSLTKGLHARSDSHSRTMIRTMSWHSWRKHSDCSFLALAFASLSNTRGSRNLEIDRSRVNPPTRVGV